MQNRILAIKNDDNGLVEVSPMIFKDRNYLLKGITNISDLDIWIVYIYGRIVSNYLKSHKETVHIRIVFWGFN